MSPEMDRVRRWFVGVALPVWFVGLTVVPLLVVWGELPEPIANHFAWDGTADASIALWLHLAFVSVFVGVCSAVLVWVARHPASAMAPQAAVATFVGWLLSSLSAIVLLANQGAARWQEVTLGGGAVVAAVGGALGASIPVALVLRGRGSSDATIAGLGLALAPTERAAWFGHARGRGMAYAAVAFIAVGTGVLLLVEPDGFGPPFILVGLTLLLFASVEVRVSAEGLRVRSGALGWPRVSFAVDEIVGARAIDLRPVRWGGWGYRGSVRFGRAAWVVRGGPALEVELTEGRRFAVTVDDAEVAAAVLVGLLSRQPTP